MRLRIAVIAAVLMAGMGASASYGEDAVLAEIYGRGVHAYFGGRYDEAESTFTDAIAQGSKDPRCYYFRGLTFYQTGKLDQANADFASGAKEEVKDVALSSLASRSLTRIQGAARQLIEKARQTARKEHRAAQVASDKIRYEEWQSNEKRMLRAAPAPEVVPPAPAAKTEEAKPAEEPAKEEPAKEEPATEEPAKEEPKSETPPPPKPNDPAADPFGSEPAKPATEPAKPAEKPAEPAKDPFGG